MRVPRATVIAAVAGVIGGAVGGLLVGVGMNPPKPKPSSDTTHTQDVVLCTSYALINAALHHPIASGRDALPAIAPLRLALTENPDANPQVREAISGTVEAYDAILAKDAKPHGLSQPPAYDPAMVTAAFDRVSQVCGLTD
jgi:hypothetical protein